MDGYTEPHWASAGLLTIDMQVEFADGGGAPIPGTSAVAAAVADVAAAFREAGRPIVHLVRLYAPGSSDVDSVRRARIESGGRIVAPGSPGSAIIAGVASGGPTDLDAAALLAGRAQPLGADEVVMFKPRWGGFYRTPLEDWLRQRSVDTVVVAGCNLPNCPRATLFEAVERDFRAVLVADAVSQTSPERLSDLALIGVDVRPGSDVLAGLRDPARRSG